MIYVSSSAPSKRSLGAVNGLGRVVASILSAGGLGVADSLFAFSVMNNVLGGNFVYFVLVGLVCVRLSVAVRLPKHMWVHGSR